MRKSLYILGQLTDLDIEWIIERGQRKSLRNGEVLIHQGHPIASLFITLSGNFAVTDEKMGGRELARLGSGEIVGEMSFIDARPPSATVAAIGDSVVLDLPRTALERKLESDSPFAARFYRALAIFLSDRLRSTVSRLGYGGPADEIDEETQQEDELDLNVLDTVHLAGTRFDHILKRLSLG